MVAVMADGLDRRTFNRLASELRITHIRCEAWGRWSKDNLTPWPDRTVLGRLIEQGPSAGETGRSNEMPEGVAQTDRAIAHLGDVDRKVVRTYYTEWQPVEYLARRCGMSVRQFHNVLNRARWRICGYLAAAT